MTTSTARILILEDDPLLAMNYVDELEAEQFACLHIERVAEAIAMLKQDQGFDVAVFDHDLPDGKGEQVLKAMIEFGIDLPVVYLSAAASSLAYLKASYSIVKKLIKKPCQPEDLVSTLQTLLSNNSTGKGSKRNRVISDTERNMILGAFDHEFQDE